jgi:enterochelin esterase-like enzyme
MDQDNLIITWFCLIDDGLVQVARQHPAAIRRQPGMIRRGVDRLIDRRRLAAVGAHYRTLADSGDRFIVGLSEGGYGAANIALHHPVEFGAAVCLSGFFRADRSAVFGDGLASVPYRITDSPANYLRTAAGQRAARRLHFTLGAGTSDGI